MTACTSMTFSTEGIPIHERTARWAAILRDTLRIDSKFEPLTEAEKFEQSLVTWALGDVLLVSCEGSAFHASWQASRSNMALASINLDGHCICRYGSRPEVLLEARSIYPFPLADGGTVLYPKPTRRIAIAFPRTQLAESFPDWEQHAGCVLPADGGAAGMLLDMALSLLRNAGELGSSCRRAAGQMLLNLLGAALGSAEKEEESAEASRLRAYHRQRIRQFILEHLADSRLSVPRIAQAVGLSPRYLHSLFTGEPLRLMQWVQEQRLERCRIRLSTPQDISSITQIAYASGFNDAAHFSRVFRKRYGLSPREFQECARSAVGTPGSIKAAQQHF